MERIKQALDKARQERQARQGDSSPGDAAQQRPGEPASGAASPVIHIDHDLLRENRIIAGLESGHFTDAYNMLRTQILQRFSANNWSVLAVTSPGPGAGNSLTAINLAISIAREVSYTVMLIDANLRHPRMLEPLGIRDRKGLGDFLVHDTPLQELMFRIEGVDRLIILPGGMPHTNSAELLNSPKMIQLVDEIKSRYPNRIIIFDLPPVLGSADTITFLPHVDAALVVIEEGVTPKQDLTQTIDLLKNTHIVGTVLNKDESKGRSK